jgi:type IV pilus assembly protein PilQ
VWDIKRRQVLIEAQIVEVSSEVERAFNVNWSYFANIGGSPFALHSGTGASGAPQAGSGGEIMGGGGQPYAVPRYGALQADSAGGISRPLLRDISGATIIDRYRGTNIAATLDYLDQQNKATILSSPRVTVQDGEEAVFENATRVPYVSSTSSYNYGSYYPQTTGTTTDPYRYRPSGSRVEFIDVGTILSVYPRVTDDSNILLDISAEDSTFTDKTIVVDDLSRTVPEKTVRRADTQVRVNSGGTIVLGGLRRDRASESTKRPPLLGDLPVIGRLFQNPSRTSRHNTLLIFITTTIVDETTMPESIEIARADAKIASAYRQGQKGLFGRLRDHLADGANEIGVSIGQSGHIHCRGENVSIEDLREFFFDAPRNKPVTVVIRKHPHADVAVVNEVTEAAMEAGLRIEFDASITPIVPAI